MSNPHKGRTGLSRVLWATRHSSNGLVAAYRREPAFRQECWGALVMIPFAPWLAHGWVETALLMSTVAFVLVVELLNSSIEAVVDRISLDLHDLSRHAKDVASAAVFLSILLCCGVWAAALWQRLASL